MGYFSLISFTEACSLWPTSPPPPVSSCFPNPHDCVFTPETPQLFSFLFGSRFYYCSSIFTVWSRKEAGSELEVSFRLEWKSKFLSQGNKAIHHVPLPSYCVDPTWAAPDAEWFCRDLIVISLITILVGLRTVCVNQPSYSVNLLDRETCIEKSLTNLLILYKRDCIKSHKLGIIYFNQYSLECQLSAFS